MSKKKKICLHIHPTFRYQSRMIKETKSIGDSRLFDQLLIVAISETEQEEYQQLDAVRHVYRLALYTRKFRGKFGKILQYLEWMGRIYWKFKSADITCVHCHHLMLLPIGVLIKRTSGSSVIYDAHELETERIALHGPLKKAAKWLEYYFIRHVDGVIVVSDSIGEWYRNTYGLSNVAVVKNIPHQLRNPLDINRNYLRTKYNIPNDALLFIYQGLLNKGRGLLILLDIFSRINTTHHLVVMGFGALESVIKQRAAQYKNIHFHPAVPPEELSQYTVEADIGICLIEDFCLSYRYSMPNKLFEYTFSGVPVIVSDFPDMGRFIDTYQCGWKTPLDVEKIRNLIYDITPEELCTKKTHAEQVRHYIGWEEEEKILLNLIQSSLSS